MTGGSSCFLPNKTQEESCLAQPGMRGSAFLPPLPSTVVQLSGATKWESKAHSAERHTAIVHCSDTALLASCLGFLPPGHCASSSWALQRADPSIPPREMSSRDICCCCHTKHQITANIPATAQFPRTQHIRLNSLSPITLWHSLFISLLTHI